MKILKSVRGGLMKTLTLFGVIVLCLGIMSDAAAESIPGRECRYRPSFNCAKADELISQEICTNPELLHVDCALGYAYREAVKKASAVRDDDLEKSEKKWVLARDIACAKLPTAKLASCIKAETVQRIRWLIEHYGLLVAGKVYETYADGQLKLPFPQPLVKPPAPSAAHP
ncbi:hypothetical protein WCLP8_1140015 [uncultured Gammaproteobacteria bacterium]